MAQGLFPIQFYSTPAGQPLSFGYILIALSSDAFSPGGQVSQRRIVKIPLDVNGEIIGSDLFWSNYDLLPVNTYYILRAYTEEGQLVLGPLKVLLPLPNTIGFGLAFGQSFGS